MRLTVETPERDELTFTGPNGSFFLRETERPVLLLAGGTRPPRMVEAVRTHFAEQA